jgi:hypothetical protein
LTAANADLDALESVAKLPPEKDEAPRTTDELQIMSLMLEGVIAERTGQLDAAIASAREAARRYDAMPFDFGPPVPIKPPHELAGEILLQAGRAKEALAEFDPALKTAPGRALSLQGRRSALAMLAPTPSAPAAIAAAVLPLPAPLRDGAAVVQLDAAGQTHEIRAGTNAMVCIADTPGDAEFDVRCYQKDFIGVVYRGFQLRREGNTKGHKVSDIVAEEIRDGRLPLSDAPTAGYRCDGPIGDYDAARSVLGPGIECWESLHFPNRTAKEMGVADESELSETEQQSTPYVMAGGTYWSHVMIRHPRGRSVH